MHVCKCIWCLPRRFFGGIVVPKATRAHVWGLRILCLLHLYMYGLGGEKGRQFLHSRSRKGIKTFLSLSLGLWFNSSKLPQSTWSFGRQEFLLCITQQAGISSLNTRLLLQLLQPQLPITKTKTTEGFFLLYSVHCIFCFLHVFDLISLSFAVAAKQINHHTTQEKRFFFTACFIFASHHQSHQFFFSLYLVVL